MHKTRGALGPRAIEANAYNVAGNTPSAKMRQYWVSWERGVRAPGVAKGNGGGPRDGATAAPRGA